MGVTRRGEDSPAAALGATTRAGGILPWQASIPVPGSIRRVQGSPHCHGPLGSSVVSSECLAAVAAGVVEASVCVAA
jgi:hypothetical protein